MLSVHDDGGERGPHLPGVFAAFSPDLKTKVVEKVKSFRVDATFVTDFEKGDSIKAGKRESIIVRLFDLFGSWLVHFNKIRPTAANYVYDVLVHAHFRQLSLVCRVRIQRDCLSSHVPPADPGNRACALGGVSGCQPRVSSHVDAAVVVRLRQ